MFFRRMSIKDIMKFQVLESMTTSIDFKAKTIKMGTEKIFPSTSMSKLLCRCTKLNELYNNSNQQMSEWELLDYLQTYF